MSRILLRALVLFTALVTLGLAAQACGGGDETADCTASNNACSDGFACTQGTDGTYTCTPAGGGGGSGGGGGGSDASDTTFTADGGSTGSDNPNITGPYSECIYGYGNSEVAIDFGIACESNADCAHETCIMPGDEGNITNDVFGFCSRGCDCNDSEDAKLPSENPDYHCIYPGGCFVGQSQGAWRHAAIRCSTLDDCLAVDERYTDCQTTNQLTVVEDTCGSLKKVCQAHQAEAFNTAEIP